MAPTKKIHIENFHLFTPEDPRHFYKIYFDKKRKDGELQPSLNQVVERWAAIDDVERREEFRKQIHEEIGAEKLKQRESEYNYGRFTYRQGGP